MPELYPVAEVRMDSYSVGAEGERVALRTNRRKELIVNDLYMALLADGRVFCASDADENDRVTGQTSYAATTPTFLLRVPSGTTAIPLWVSLGATGSVAGGDISILMSYDRVDRYGSAGTSEAIASMHTGRPVTVGSTLYSGATAAAATDARLLFASGELPAVAGAGTATRSDNTIFLAAMKDFFPPYLVGPSAWLIFTWAATTGPTYEWSVGWAEIPSTAD